MDTTEYSVVLTDVEAQTHNISHNEQQEANKGEISSEVQISNTSDLR